MVPSVDITPRQESINSVLLLYWIQHKPRRYTNTHTHTDLRLFLFSSQRVKVTTSTTHGRTPKGRIRRHTNMKAFFSLAVLLLQGTWDICVCFLVLLLRCSTYISFDMNTTYYYGVVSGGGGGKHRPDAV